MPFVSVKQRNYLKWKHPDVYNKFKAEHGTAIAKDWTLADLGNIAKAAKGFNPPDMPEHIKAMPENERPKAYAQWRKTQGGPTAEQWRAKVDEARVKGREAGAAAEHAKYRPDVFARMASAKKLGRGKTALIAGGIGTAALLASPMSRHNRRPAGESPQEANRRRRNAGARTAAGAALGAGGAYGAYAGGTYYGLERKAGLRSFGNAKPGEAPFKGHPQADEINEVFHRHGAGHGTEAFERAHPEFKGKPKPEYEKGFNEFRRKQWPKINAAYQDLPHHIQGAGASKLANRIYGPSKYGRKAGVVLGTGALAGAAFAHGLPGRRQKQAKQLPGRPPLRLIQGGRAA